MEQEIRYAKDKPKSCEFCFYYEGKKVGCVLGKEHCYYRLPELKEEKPKSKCDNCCVSKVRKCIGFCIVEIASKRGGNSDGNKHSQAQSV